MIAPSSPPSRQPLPNHDTIPLVDLLVLCAATYLTYTRFPAHWKTVLCNFYVFFITVWAYGEVHGAFRPNVSLGLRLLNMALCFVNLLLDAA
jgi:antibiotic biosynthesis monooxygenase (ABM) superfamily enzyme